jgi:hypothetical protein
MAAQWAERLAALAAVGLTAQGRARIASARRFLADGWAKKAAAPGRGADRNQ